MGVDASRHSRVWQRRPARPNLSPGAPEVGVVIKAGEVVEFQELRPACANRRFRVVVRWGLGRRTSTPSLNLSIGWFDALR